MSADGRHVVFPCGEGNDTHYSLVDFHTDDFHSYYGSWSIGAYPTSGAFSPNGKYFAATNTTQLQIWDATTYTKSSTVAGCKNGSATKSRVAFSLGGRVAFVLAQGCYRLNGVDVGLLTYQALP